ncbi:hypothetical protein QJS66_04720 [Kocuria rhizophila]|nr:hypothetical protein QJS66_04720 [Kocuria rhizophila]
MGAVTELMSASRCSAQCAALELPGCARRSPSAGCSRPRGAWPPHAISFAAEVGHPPTAREPSPISRRARHRLPGGSWSAAEYAGALAGSPDRGSVPLPDDAEIGRDGCSRTSAGPGSRTPAPSAEHSSPAEQHRLPDRGAPLREPHRPADVARSRSAPRRPVPAPEFPLGPSPTCTRGPGLLLCYCCRPPRATTTSAFVARRRGPT